MRVTVAVMGQTNVGKTCFISYYEHRCFVGDYDPSVGNCYRKVNTVGQHKVIVELLEIFAYPEYASLVEQWIRDCEGFILAFSITNRDSFLGLPGLVELISKYKEQKTPLIVLATQCDIEEARAITVQEGFEFAASLEVPYFEASSKYAVNVDEVVETVVGEVLMWLEHSMSPNARSCSRQKGKECVIC